MASATEYAKWLVDNKDKQGTPEFETVSDAYRHLREQSAPAEPSRVGKFIGSVMDAGTMGALSATRQAAADKRTDARPHRGNPFFIPVPGAPEAATMARMAAPAARLGAVGAAIAFPPTSPAALIGLGSGMAGGELLARHMEGKPNLDREAIGEAVKAFTMGSIGAPAIASSGPGLMQGGRALLSSAAKFGGGAGATAALGESMKRHIQGTPQYESFAEAWKDVAPAVVLGGTMGFGATALGRLGTARGIDNAAKAKLAEVGIEDPTMAMVRPQYAAAEERIAATRGALQEKVAAANDAAVRHAYGRIGEAVGNAEIGTKLEPIIRTVDDAAAVMAAAQKEAAAAQEMLATATKNAQGLPPEQVMQITKEAQARLLNAAMGRASANYRMAASAPDFVSPTLAAQEVGGALRAVKDARSGISADLYGNFYRLASEAAGAPITPSTPIFEKDAILKLAETNLAATHRQNAPYAKDIMASIAGIKGVARQVPDPKTGIMVEKEFFDKATLDALKDTMAQKFAQAAPGTMTAADSAVSSVYTAVNNAANNQLAAQFGPMAAQALDQARTFHRITSQLEDSSLGRALLRKASGGQDGEIQNVAEHAIESVANGIAHGRVDELNKFKEFVEAVGQFTQPVQVAGKTVQPAAVASLAKQTMVNAIRNAFQTKHLKANGVDYPAMLDDLLKAAQYDKLPFPVEKFGFGTPERVKLWRDTLRTFKGEDVTDEVVGNMLQNPEVRRVVENGGFDGKRVLANAAAEEIFARKVKDQVTLEAAGRTADARRAAEAARNLAAEHNAISAKASAVYERARANPLLGAFEGRGNYKFKDEAQKAGEGTVYHLIQTTAPQYRSGLMDSLRNNNPQLAEVVERRVLTDELGKFVARDPQKAGNFRLDVGKIREYFNPLDKANSEVAQLRDMVGAEPVKKLESLLTKFADIEAGLSRGRVPTPRDGETIGRILGLATLPATGLQGQARLSLPVRVVNTVMDLWQRGAYNTLSNVVLDKGFAGAFVRHSGDVSQMMSSLPAQKAYLMMADPRLAAELQEEKKP